MDLDTLTVLNRIPLRKENNELDFFSSLIINNLLVIGGYGEIRILSLPEFE